MYNIVLHIMVKFGVRWYYYFYIKLKKWDICELIISPSRLSLLKLQFDIKSDFFLRYNPINWHPPHAKVPQAPDDETFDFHISRDDTGDKENKDGRNKGIKI